MEMVKWNPGEVIINDQSSPKDASQPFIINRPSGIRNESVQKKMKVEQFYSEEEMARHFEIIRRRQSQYTAACSSPTKEKKRRELFCTSLEDGVEM